MESYDDKNKSSSLRNSFYSGLTSALKNTGKYLKKAAPALIMYAGVLGCRSAYQGFENLPKYRQASALTSLEYSLGGKPSVVADNIKKYISPKLPLKVDRAFENYNWDANKEKLGKLYWDVKGLKDVTSVAANINEISGLVILADLVKEGGLTEDIKQKLGKDATLDGFYAALTDGKQDGKNRVKEAIDMILSPATIQVFGDDLYGSFVKVEEHIKKLDDKDQLKGPLSNLMKSYRSNLEGLFKNMGPLIEQEVAEGKYSGDLLGRSMSLKFRAYDALHSTKLIELGKKVYDIYNVDGTNTTKESKNSLKELLNSELKETKNLFKEFPPHTIDRVVHDHRYKIASKLADLRARNLITEEQQLGALLHLELGISAGSIGAGKSEDSFLLALIPGLNLVRYIKNDFGYLFVPDRIQYKTLEERLIHNTHIYLGNTNLPHEAGDGNKTSAIAKLLIIGAEGYGINQLLKDKDKKRVIPPTGPTGTGGENNGGPGGN